MTQLIEQFEKMGARAKVIGPEDLPRRRRQSATPSRGEANQPIRVNILRDGKGEYFEIVQGQETDVRVVDVRKGDRHLLLQARRADRPKDEPPSKFLCGHDERAWFVAAIPEAATVRNVQDAKDALKPQAVWEAIRAHGVSQRHRDRRRTAAFVRQGEWFFIPRPGLQIEESKALRNEPIRRGSGKPHLCQFMHRAGGEQVYVSRLYPNGLSPDEYRKLDPAVIKAHRWNLMVRNARVLVKGSVRHSDHKTVWLPDWHEVVMNTETQASAMRHVAFLD